MNTPWKALLTRDRMYCVICFHESQARQAREGALSSNAEGRAESWVRIGLPTKELNPINPRTAGAYAAKLKADFRRHIKERHPDWMSRINWTRAL